MSDAAEEINAAAWRKRALAAERQLADERGWSLQEARRLERQLAAARAEIERLRSENTRLSWLHNLELDRSNAGFAALTDNRE